MKSVVRQLLIAILVVSMYNVSIAQTIINGSVRDAVTKEPLQSVSIYFKGGKGVTTNANGLFTLTTVNDKFNRVNISYVGYKPQVITVEPNKEQTVEVNLLVAETKEVIVKTNKRGKYSNKDNPAVELIKKVIDNKNKNKISAYDYVQYEQYEKMQLSLTNKPEKLLNNKLLKNYKFILENQDSSKIEGKALTPVYLEETVSEKYYRNNPDKSKTIILGNKKVNFGEYIDSKGLSNYLNRMYEDVDVYQNNISLLSNQFLSPIADLAPTFYRFYIRDTVEQNGVKLVRLSFSPKNLNDILFKGTIFVTLDGNYSVQKINMSISKKANINWVRELHIDQDFEKGADGRYHVIKSNTMAEFALTKSANGGIMGERAVSYKDYTINKALPDAIFSGDAVVVKSGSETKNEAFWQQHRQPPLNAVEAGVYTNIDSLVNMRSYKRFMDVATLLFAGYKSVGGYEVGPVNAFYSFNPVEGLRVRLGGRTNPKFNKSLYLENYVAYGFKDKKWKYFGAATYSFNHKSIYSYPLNYLRLSYQYDTKIPGQELQFVQEDNFLLSFKRGANDRWLYNNIFKAEYVRELRKNVAVTVGFKNWKQTPAGTISFNRIEEGGIRTVTDLTTTELSAELRWAPNEQFYQGKVYRIPIINKFPVFKLRYIAGIKGLAKGEYNYHNLNLNVTKRFYASQLGYTDLSVEGGYIFGKVPYPLLTIHRANQTYAYQLNSYNLMNFMEFVSDHYASAHVDHYFNGFFFNKIPLIKTLRLREVVAAKVLYGGVRQENNPEVLTNTTSFKYPESNVSGTPTTFSLNKEPYVEVSVGIANIFKLLRVDFVKRLTHLNNPDISKFGIRVMMKFDF